MRGKSSFHDGLEIKGQNKVDIIDKNAQFFRFAINKIGWYNKHIKGQENINDKELSGITN